MPPPPKEHQFKPGQSGNKFGRPKGLGAMIRAQLEGHREKIIDAQIAIAEGQKPVDFTGPAPRPADITKAAEWLFDRGYHKPLQRVEHDGQVQVGTQDLTKMPREQLEEWLAGAERAELAEDDDDGPADEAEGPTPG